jgi:hypothetical protein
VQPCGLRWWFGRIGRVDRLRGLAHGKVLAWLAHAMRRAEHTPKAVTALWPPAVARLPSPRRRRIRDAVFMSDTSEEQGTRWAW